MYRLARWIEECLLVFLFCNIHPSYFLSIYIFSPWAVWGKITPTSGLIKGSRVQFRPQAIS